MQNNDISIMNMIRVELRNAEYYSSCVVEAIYTQKIDIALRDYSKILGTIAKLLSIEYQEKTLELIDVGHLMAVLKEMSDSQLSKNYLLLADTLDLKLKPMLIDAIKCLKNSGFISMDIRERKNLNVEFLTERAKDNSEISELLQVILESKKDDKYKIVLAQNGLLNLVKEENDKKLYFHSMVDPVMGSQKEVSKLMYEPAQKYAVLGIAFGYHLYQIYEMCPGADIHVYEWDKELIKCIFDYFNLEVYINKYHVTIHYDPDFTKFSHAIQEKGIRVHMHYQSLQNISNLDIQRKYMNHFIRENSFDTFKNSLYINFHSNMKQINNVVDSLKDVFLKKTVYIIAAGPSLDKNIHLLKGRDKNSLVIAVGTVLKKILKQGIIPDYAIATDAKSSISQQFQDIKENIPVLLATTACKEIALTYSHDKYLIFQEGYEYADKVAKERGHLSYATGGSVSTLAMSVAVQLGAERVVFLGLDMAFTNMKSHAESINNQAITSEEELFKVPSFEKKDFVLSDNKFDIYRTWFTNKIRDLRNEGCTTEIINATEGGAFIEGMDHISLDKVIEWKKNRSVF